LLVIISNSTFSDNTSLDVSIQLIPKIKPQSTQRRERESRGSGGREEIGVFVSLLKAGVTIPKGFASINLRS
jgi:hypothetical protein